MTIEEIKNEVAVEHGYSGWEHLHNSLNELFISMEDYDSYYDIAMQRYADHVKATSKTK